MRYLIAFLCAAQLGATTIAECRVRTNVVWADYIDYHELQQESDPNRCVIVGYTGHALAETLYGYVRVESVETYWDGIYEEITEAWSSFSQQATITGRTAGTTGYYRLYGDAAGFPLWAGDGGHWNVPEDSPFAPFTFGTPFTISMDLYSYISEGWMYGNVLLWGMEVYDSQQRSLAYFGWNRDSDPTDKIPVLQQSPEAVYAVRASQYCARAACIDTPVCLSKKRVSAAQDAHPVAEKGARAEVRRAPCRASDRGKIGVTRPNQHRKELQCSPCGA